MVVIRIPKDSTLREILDKAEASGETILLDTGTARYVVTRETLRVIEGSDIWANYDPARAIAAIEAAAGSWSDVDVESVKAMLYQARDEGTRPDSLS